MEKSLKERLNTFPFKKTQKNVDFIFCNRSSGLVDNLGIRIIKNKSWKKV